jgi:hypothetical protein
MSARPDVRTVVLATICGLVITASALLVLPIAAVTLSRSRMRGSISLVRAMLRCWAPSSVSKLAQRELRYAPKSIVRLNPEPSRWS